MTSRLAFFSWDNRNLCENGLNFVLWSPFHRTSGSWKLDPFLWVHWCPSAGQVKLLMTSQLVLKHPFHGTTEPFDDQSWLVSRYPFAGQVELLMTERLASDISVYAKLCIYTTNRETTGKSLFNPHPNSHNGYPMDIQHTGTTSICRMMFWITRYVKVNYSCCRSLEVTNLIHEGSLAGHVFAFLFP